MITIPRWVDHFLSLPLPLLALCLIGYWSCFAWIVHRYLVPWIAGREGNKLGRLEAEVPAQIGLAFGLLVSFIAIPVWEQHTLAEEAARTEAAAYREMAESIEDSESPAQPVLLGRVHDVVDFIVDVEWPQMPSLLQPRITAPPLRVLRTAIHDLPDGSLQTELHDLYRQASTARETRLRIAATRPPPTRWTVVGLLAILTLVGVGLIHADSRRARRIALGMVAIGISCCFMLLFAYTRPYIGQFAVHPADLRMLRLDLDESAAASARTAGTPPAAGTSALR